MNQEISPPDSSSINPTLAAPSPSYSRMLATWVRVMNISYYGLPIALLIVYLLGLALVAGSSSAGGSIMLFVLLALGLYVLIPVLALIGLAVIVLNAVYLAKAKPVGVWRGLLIASLCFVVVSYPAFAWIALSLLH